MDGSPTAGSNPEVTLSPMRATRVLLLYRISPSVEAVASEVDSRPLVAEHATTRRNNKRIAYLLSSTPAWQDNTFLLASLVRCHSATTVPRRWRGNTAPPQCALPGIAGRGARGTGRDAAAVAGGAGDRGWRATTRVQRVVTRGLPLGHPPFVVHSYVAHCGWPRTRGSVPTSSALLCPVRA